MEEKNSERGENVTESQLQKNSSLPFIFKPSLFMYMHFLGRLVHSNDKPLKLRQATSEQHKKCKETSVGFSIVEAFLKELVKRR